MRSIQLFILNILVILYLIIGAFPFIKDFLAVRTENPVTDFVWITIAGIRLWFAYIVISLVKNNSTQTSISVFDIRLGWFCFVISAFEIFAITSLISDGITSTFSNSAAYIGITLILPLISAYGTGSSVLHLQKWKKNQASNEEDAIEP
jgi:hypothetical protein